jgi:hypothetical protein
VGRRQISADGEVGERVFHAIEIGTDDWVYSGPRWAGVLVSDWQHLITQIADLIGEGKVYNLHSPVGAWQPIDRAGNTWLEREYLAPHQYLPRLIPKEGIGG